MWVTSSFAVVLCGLSALLVLVAIAGVSAAFWALVAGLLVHSVTHLGRPR